MDSLVYLREDDSDRGGVCLRKTVRGIPQDIPMLRGRKKMIRRTFVVTIFSAFVIFITVGISYAQEMSFSANGGISNPVGDGSEYWNLGVSIGGNLFRSVSPNFSFGGRVAYNRWTPDEDKLLESVAGIDPGISWDISGSATIIELVPSIRLLAPMGENQSASIFGQLGLGYFLLNMNAEVKGSYLGTTHEVSMDESESEVGLSVGGGLAIGEKGRTQFEILPLYHIIFTEDETTKYFSVSLGVIFGA